MEFVLEQAGLARMPSGIDSICQNFIGKGWNWLEFLQERVGWTRILSVMGQNSFRNGWDWSEFLQERA